ncbi:MAG: VWA domain-containing protein [Caldilineaceae bacterium]
MFWNRRSQTNEIEEWAERLEAGATNEPSLEIAAKLRAVTLAKGATNPFFKARIRQHLIAIHGESTTGPQTDRDDEYDRPHWFQQQRRWLVLGIVLLLIMLYRLRFRWLALLGGRVDDWQYTFFDVVDGRIQSISKALFPNLLLSLTELVSLGLAVSFGASLIIYLFEWIAALRQPERRQIGHWSRLGRQGLRLSGVLAVLLVALINIDWARQQPTPQFTAGGYSSPIATPQQVALLAPSIASPLGAEAESSVNNLPANEMDKVPETNVQDSQIILGLRMQAEPAAELSSSIQAASAALATSIPAPSANNSTRTTYSLESPAALAPASAIASNSLAVVPTTNLGFAVGGAKDINNFRENIDQGYLPLSTDVTVEGLFYDYYFETGQQAPCTQLFCPSYTQATSRDPISGEPQHFLAVGLNSGLQSSDLARKRLNLVVVLDISGSMGEQFNRYYYDGAQALAELQWGGKSKLAVATQAITALIDHLQPDDRLAIVLFDDQAYLAKDLRAVGETDMASIKQHVLDLREQGGTNMEAGYRMGSELLSAYANADPAAYENRLIFLTDAQPNTGATGAADLLALTQANAEQHVHTTFIGIGVDFNSELVEGLTKVRGANYYAAHSPVDFMQRMDDEFDFMVTPVLFDLTLTFNSPDYVIEQVYGSPEADAATGELMGINTLFPSASRGGAVKGGVVLLQLGARSGVAAEGEQPL